MGKLAKEVENLEGIDDASKVLYIQDGESYKLNPVISVYEDRVTKMDSKISELLTETKQFKHKAKEQSELAAIKAKEIEEKNLLDLEKNNDFEAFKKSTQDRHNKDLAEKDSEVDFYKKIAVRQSSGHDAMKLSSEIALVVNGASTAAHLEPQFSRRLRTAFVDGKAVVEVLDSDGNLSAMTQKELQDEIKNMPINSMIVSGSKAKGAGLTPNNNTDFSSQIDLSKLTPKQKIEYARKIQ